MLLLSKCFFFHLWSSLFVPVFLSWLCFPFLSFQEVYVSIAICQFFFYICLFALTFFIVTDLLFFWYSSCQRTLEQHVIALCTWWCMLIMVCRLLVLICVLTCGGNVISPNFNWWDVFSSVFMFIVYEGWPKNNSLLNLLFRFLASSCINYHVNRAQLYYWINREWKYSSANHLLLFSHPPKDRPRTRASF